MADIVKGPLAETSFDREKALRSDLARVTAERDHLAEREALFIKALSPVCDAGQYRADVVSAIGRVVSERDALRAEVEAMRGALEKIAGIANRPTGQDWEEIEEARRIALDALRARKVGG